ncbi:MAG: regulatory protein TetR [Solirubrobacteraceae bacterium]|nr:regulatory protein TetR [Solirubrobacteraceae bacterium]
MPHAASVPRRGSGPTATRAARARVNAKGDATRLLILLTAEELFAERGIAGVPLRDVAVAAGQRNNIAVQYHFGDREGLLHAITEYRAAPSDLARSRMIEEHAAGAHEAGLRDSVEMLVLPLAGHLVDGDHFLGFLSRYHIERGDYHSFGDLQGAGSMRLIYGLARRLVPDCPEPIFVARWKLTLSTAVHQLAQYQTLLKRQELPATIDELVSDLVAYLTSGLGASAAGGPRHEFMGAPDGSG